MPSDDKYQQWIDANVSPIPAAVRGRCIKIVGLMIEAFPELRAASGTFGAEPHWWCVDPSGMIIDPTRHQFDRNEGYEETPRHTYRDTADGRMVIA